ncbi:DUF4198 domain-containing protein [Asticcacaulis sp. BYS171W]|uniref:DUF4198 domain-containing protein n=1 Tax=Asticcacaulis aquaticus TaxID=2984212 RepID=A0ABT5HWK6_9CAUL|nr:DUF4198 domain-containing protein [Asticcacaulis aquaticus]MDC7684460.1 DUF4198 domain-containing protein [Asticcacaulis aquaticus]
MKRILAVTVATMMLTTPAVAHTPYLVPFNFAPTEGVVTVHNGLTNNTFFVPEFPIKGDDYEVTDADGKVTAGKGVSFTEVGLFEAKLSAEGTYRISTGNRDVRTLNLARIDGKWRPVKMPVNGVVPEPFVDQSKLSPTSRIVPVKTMVRAETYISYKKPSTMAPPPDGKGLEIVPLTHPNQLFAGGIFQFRLAFDGKPLADTEWQAFRANDAYAARTFNMSGKTASDGTAQINFAEPGVYVIEILRNWEKGNPEDPRTWLSSLTLEVAQ